MSRKLEIDFDVADKITYLNLKDWRAYLKKELKQHKKGVWMHPEDVVMNMKYIDALDLIIKAYEPQY